MQYRSLYGLAIGALVFVAAIAVAQDDFLAKQRHLAEQGDIKSQFILGFMYKLWSLPRSTARLC